MSWGQARQFWLDSSYPEQRVADLWLASPKWEVPWVAPRSGEARREGSCVRHTCLGIFEVLALVEIQPGTVLPSVSSEPANDPDQS